MRMKTKYTMLDTQKVTHCTKKEVKDYVTKLVTFTEEILNGKLHFFVQLHLLLISAASQITSLPSVLTTCVFKTL